MGGGLMQLVAYGAQDIYLTGNPQITFFKVVYRRHTNFAVESIEQTFNGSADFGKRVTATISRNGDLIQQMYLEVVLPVLYTTRTTANDVMVWTYGVGNALVKQAEIEIGGQLIDRQYGDWMNIWSELTTPAGKRAGYDNMVGNSTNTAIIDSQNGGIEANASKRLYVPFQFWFNRNPGLALPLIALQYHEVKLNLELRALSELYQVNVTLAAAVGNNAPVQGTVTPNDNRSLVSCKLYVDYVYLDTDERRRFAQVSHEYLIEQVQFTGAETVAAASTNKNVTLNFNHPVKELVWVHTTSDNAKSNVALTTNAIAADTTGNYWFNYSGTNASANVDNANPPNTVTTPTDSFTTALLQLNGHDRFSVRFADYFRKVQNYEHHTSVPRVSAERDVADNRSQFIYTYSFALSPEEHQPSGTCNFSRIDNAVLQLSYAQDSQTLATAVIASMNLNIYAINYNVLRIMSGMGGLAYSN
jgi:Major capsid protein N-terminus/Large eukaryotic DNA virus major capsid protein